MPSVLLFSVPPTIDGPQSSMPAAQTPLFMLPVALLISVPALFTVAALAKAPSLFNVAPKLLFSVPLIFRTLQRGTPPISS